MHRYVILEHTWNGIHFDLMIEWQSTLKTWQLTKMLEPGPQPATLLPDHRLDYLTYEGPISGNRGSVKRVAEGNVIYREGEAPAELFCDANGSAGASPSQESYLEMELQGTFYGLLKLVRLQNNNWQLEWNPTKP